MLNVDIPEHLKAGLEMYVKDGIEPGSFLQAVLKNDLIMAVGLADQINRPRLASIVNAIFNSEDVPDYCWGSQEIYKNHILSFTESGKTMQISTQISNFISANIPELEHFNAEDLKIVIGTFSAKGSLFAKKECKLFRSALGNHPVETAEIHGIFIAHSSKTWEIK